jgi:DNA-binding SARP family transcriptional activator
VNTTASREDVTWGSAQTINAESANAGVPTLCLLGGPHVLFGSRVIDVPDSSMRLLVFIALHPGRVDRRFAAGSLWPNGDDDRAAGNLRSALWRLKGTNVEILHAEKFALWLNPSTAVDLREIDHWAGRMIEGRVGAEDLRVPQLGGDAMDLLPGWYDDWVIFERERLRQRLLHALEALSRKLVDTRQYAEAIEVALMAVSGEPLRESAHRALLEAHFAEGNLGEARRLFRDYRSLIRKELGVEPGRELATLVETHLPGSLHEPVASTFDPAPMERSLR